MDRPFGEVHSLLVVSQLVLPVKECVNQPFSTLTAPSTCVHACVRVFVRNRSGCWVRLSHTQSRIGEGTIGKSNSGINMR